MELTGNTVLVTGGGSGIGAGLASAFHGLGNSVIVAGRDEGRLDAMLGRHPGMAALHVDVADADSVLAAVGLLRRRHPAINAVIHCAGIMVADDPGSVMDGALLEAHFATNVLGPVRVTSALMAQLRRQPRAHLVYVTAAAAFTPVAMFAAYSASKAALHSYVLSQRYSLKDSRVTVQEIVPPWVGTGLAGPPDHAMAMPLAPFIEQTMAALATDAAELVLPEARHCRDNAGAGEHAYVDRFNTWLLGQSF